MNQVRREIEEATSSRMADLRRDPAPSKTLALVEIGILAYFNTWIFTRGGWS